MLFRSIWIAAVGWQAGWPVLLLETLLRAAGLSCSKLQLLDASADGRRDVGEDTIKAHIRNLRGKLCAAGAPPNLIETVYGLGYRLNPAFAA